MDIFKWFRKKTDETFRPLASWNMELDKNGDAVFELISPKGTVVGPFGSLPALQSYAAAQRWDLA